MAAWLGLLGVVVGGIVAGGAAIWGQVITHRGTDKRERQGRRDAFRVKRFEIDRDALIALQDAIAEFNLAWLLVVQHEITDDGYPELIDSLGEKHTAITKLAARILDDEARLSVYDYLRVAQATLNPRTHDDHTRMRDAHDEAQDAVGRALRHDPFSDPSNAISRERGRLAS